MRYLYKLLEFASIRVNILFQNHAHHIEKRYFEKIRVKFFK